MRPEVAGRRNLDHVCLPLGPHDGAALRAHLAAHGVEIVEEEMHDGPYRSPYLRDPSGDLIDLKAPPRGK